MRRAPDAANNVMCERIGETQRGAHNAKGFLLRKKEEEMRTKKKIAMLVAMAAAAVVLVALVGSGPASAQMIWE